MARAFAEIAFTQSVRDTQTQQGSADSYSKFLTPEAERGDRLGGAEQEFISARDGFYQASVSETNWPYVQFRGGPAGFLKVLNYKTIAYADFRGNRQYVSAGNLTVNDRVSLILMDYPNRRRLKIWGRVKLVGRSEDPDLVSSLQIEGYRALPERAVVITIEAFDWNCPQHIPQRLTAQEMEPLLSQMRNQIAELTEENAELKSWLKPTK
ncbi:MAG: pyridoxamine 5'-phosphate oxidase family protein [Rhizobiaceae bacterium]|nr:pyridoxamine 5'-phosphate oxidase family protein [Rhizobiaceae bacterium]